MQNVSEISNCVRSDFRPWGYFRVIENDRNYKLKEIVVHPEKRLSLQSHFHRSEVWTVIAGKGKAVIGEDLVELFVGKVVTIEKEQKHRLINDSTTDLVVLEIQLGDILEESDIVRYEDDFNRIN